jgi:hypothetical protein
MATLVEDTGQYSAPSAPPTGDAFLAALPPQTAAVIKKYATGELPISPMMARTPQGQQLLGAVAQYDPTFDAVNYQARASTRKDFVSGKSADNITALNTAIQHLGKLNTDFNTLGNTNFPAYNSAANWLGNQLGNTRIQSATANVNTDSEAVAHELAKVFRSTGMSEAEIRAWKDQINADASPSSMKSTIGSAVGLMEGRLQALGDRYKQGMGTDKEPLKLLNPEAQKTWETLQYGGNAPPKDGSAKKSSIGAGGWSAKKL